MKTRAFRVVVIGWGAANFADSLLTLILVVWVADLTGSAFWGGLTFAMLGLAALASPVLGHIADRVSQRKMLVVSYVVAALGISSLFWVVDKQQLWLVYLATVVYAGVSYVTGACQSGILKALLPESELGRANGVLTMIDQVFRIALPFVGAGVYVWVGIRPLIASAIIAFGCAALIFACVRLAEPHVEPVREAYAQAVAAGFRHLFGTQPLGALTWTLFAALAAIAAVNGVVFAALAHLGVPAAWLGPLTVGQGVGGILAGAATPRLMDRFGRVKVYGIGVVLMGVGLTPLIGRSVALVAISQIVVGFAITSAIIAFMTERQIATPHSLQGRVAAASQVMFNLPGFVITGAAAATTTMIDFRFLVVATVVIIVASGLIALRARAVSLPPDRPISIADDGSTDDA